MKQNDIKNALNEINPDLYMKTRLEAKVSQKAHPKTHKRVFTAGIAGALCVAIVAVSMGVGGITMKTSPITTNTTVKEVISSKVAPGFVILAYADENNNVTKTKLNDDLLKTSMPVKYQLAIQNIKGMSEGEIEKKFKEFSKEVEVMDMKNADCGFSSVERLDNALVSQIQLNYFDLDLDEYNNVEKITASNKNNYGEVAISSYDAFFDENGNVYKDAKKHEEASRKAFIKGQKVEIDAKRYIKCRSEDYFFGISWKPSQALFDEINKNPDFDMSSIKDTMVFEVQFKNGAVSKSVIDISFDKDGNMFATPQEFNYID